MAEIGPGRKMLWFRDMDIEFTLRELDSIFATKVFEDQSHPLLVSAVTRCLIGLNDLLQKAHDEGRRIDVTDHIIESEGIRDLTDLISKARNACCHIGSGLHRDGPWKITWNIGSGKGLVATVDDVPLTNEFDDEIAIFFGRLRIYLRRHLQRAFEEVVNGFSDRRWT